MAATRRAARSWRTRATFTAAKAHLLFAMFVGAIFFRGRRDISGAAGIDSPEEIAWKSRYDVAMIDNSLTLPECRDTTTGIINLTRCNDFKAQRCADLKAFRPDLPCFTYRSGPFGCGNLEGEATDPTQLWWDSVANITRRIDSTWLAAPNGTLLPGQCDFRKVVGLGLGLKSGSEEKRNSEFAS